jgi:hypothetical protein
MYSVAGRQTQSTLEQMQKELIMLRRQAEIQEHPETLEALEGRKLEPGDNALSSKKATDRMSIVSYDLPLQPFVKDTVSLVRR